MNDLMRAIYEVLQLDAGPGGVHTLLGGRYYAVAAPQNTQAPYMVYAPVAGTSELTFDAKDFERVRVQFTVISSASSPRQGYQVLDRLAVFLSDRIIDMPPGSLFDRAAVLRESMAWATIRHEDVYEISADYDFVFGKL